MLPQVGKLLFHLVNLSNKRRFYTMDDFKTYLSTAPVLLTIWLSFTAGLLIEFNRFYPDALFLG